MRGDSPAVYAWLRSHIAPEEFSATAMITEPAPRDPPLHPRHGGPILRRKFWNTVRPIGEGWAPVPSVRKRPRRRRVSPGPTPGQIATQMSRDQRAEKRARNPWRNLTAGEIMDRLALFGTAAEVEAWFGGPVGNPRRP